MVKVFEDSFMEVQGGLVALCEELAEGISIDKIYVYGSIETGAVSFDAFYLSQGKIIIASKISNDVSMIKQFLRLGSSDLIKLTEVCKEHNKPVPTELRLQFNTSSRSLDAHYEYKSICGPESDLLPMDVFLEWKES